MTSGRGSNGIPNPKRRRPPRHDQKVASGSADSGLFLNRELSWLDFNDRVLQLAESPDLPLLERVKFLAIHGRNLDEFFMIRVARLHEYAREGVNALAPDGAPPEATLAPLREGILAQCERVSTLFQKTLRPRLAEKGIRIESVQRLRPEEKAQLDERYREQIFPVLTPLAIGLGRHFPYISNLSLSLAVLLHDPATDSEAIARIKVPKGILPRFLRIGGTLLVPIEEVIAEHLPRLFPGMKVLEHTLFRVTRNADFTVSDDAEDLLQAVQTELRQRRFGDVIRLEVPANIPAKLKDTLIDALGLQSRQVYEEAGLLDYSDLHEVLALPGFAELRDPPWTPLTQPRLLTDDGETRSVIAEMRRGDLLVHLPYESFTTSVERFVTEAVDDPDVLAIKQTVYRTSDTSPLVPALIRATENGKQAVCTVELKARFDERLNIRSALALEEAGVHVTYGIPGLKTHAKTVLVVRREGDKIRHYVHVGTGNLNPKTARTYTDLSLFTTDPDIGADVADLFNFLTGFARPTRFRKLLVAPLTMRQGLVEEIRRTQAAHSAERPSRIWMKLNALVDAEMIRALYTASQAGVQIQLNVRGICCLKPGVPGLSENIRVVSTLGRFLEHSRVYLFDHGTGTGSRCFLGSADLMPRNLNSRVEVLAPVEDAQLVAQIRDMLERHLADTRFGWELGPGGRWTRRSAGSEPPRHAQQELMDRAVRLAQASAGRTPE